MSWLSYTAFRSYANLRKSGIKVWLKARYLILSITSFIFMLDGISILLLIINSFEIILFLIYLAVWVVSLFSIGNFICWILPVFHHRDKISNSEDELENLEEQNIIDDIKSQLSEDGGKDGTT
jgi:hypothetical protein